MLLRSITKHVKDQNWFAVALDFIIVVFGVFIGMQVSNWNEIRSDRKLESIYLQRLYDDVSLSIRRNEGSVDFMERHAQYGSLILDVLDRCEIDPSEADTFASGIFLAGKITPPVFLRSSIDELKSTGKFDVIRNMDVRRIIAELLETIEFRSVIDQKVFLRATDAVSEIERKVIVTQTEAINPAGDITADRVIYDLPTLCQDQTFKHAISTTRSLTFSSIYFTNDIIALQKQALVLLEAELSSQ